MNLTIYGEIGIDWLISHDASVTDRWGGAGLYAALAASRQEAEVEFFTLVGPELKKNTFSLWEHLGVSISSAQFNEDYSFPRYLVTGFRNYETKVSRPMSEVKFNHKYSPKVPTNSEGLLAFPIGHTIPIELCEEAFKRGIPVFLDPKPNRDSISDARKALPYTTILLANEEEILLLADEDERSNAIDKLKGMGPEYVVVKSGIRGCSIFHKGVLIAEIPAFISSVKYTLGSGDVFGGALATTFLRTKDIKYSVDLASCVAANFIENFEIEAVISRRAAQRDMLQRNRAKLPCDKINVYLAGPFFCAQELNWINQVCKMLEGAGINVLSPSRENGIIKPNEEFEGRQQVFRRDLELLEKADLLVAILDHDDTGTCFEIGYAFKKQVPVIGLKTSMAPLNNMIAFGCRKIYDSIEQLIQEIYTYGK